MTLVQNYLDRVQNRARDRKLTIHLDNDAAAFVGFLSAQKATHGVSSIHDPEYSHITPDRFLWMRIDDGNRGVCCHAIRMIETDDLLSEVLTYRVFGDLRVVRDYQDLRLYPEAWDIGIAGRIVIGGGLWVDPDYRGRDYSALFRKLLRVMAIRHFRLEYYVSFIRNTQNRRSWVLGSYGSPHVTPLLHGYYPPYGRSLDVQLAHASRAEILSRVRVELAQPDPTVGVSRTPEYRLTEAPRDGNTHAP
jgi:GNAT superfamily N-acetyltransferase